MKEIIKLENIKRDFKVGDETVHALRGVSFTIYEGEFVTIMGTSGSGKSMKSHRHESEEEAFEGVHQHRVYPHLHMSSH